MNLVLTTYNKLNHLLHPIVGELWCLHRVVPTRSKFPSNRELEITPDYLESLILDYRSRGYRFATIDEIINNKSYLSQKVINITFDDGFSDIYTYAYPIFKKYAIPFTIYLTTDFPDKKADLWWIQLERLCIDTTDFEQKLKQIYDSDKPLASIMHALTESQIDLQLTNLLTLSWEQIREMVDSNLCTIGSHTVSHPALTRINSTNAEMEICLSKTNIENKLSAINYKVKHFSYPHSMVDEHIREMVVQAGYLSASLGYGGSIRKNYDKYMLNRKYIVQV